MISFKESDAYMFVALRTVVHSFCVLVFSIFVLLISTNHTSLSFLSVLWKMLSPEPLIIP